MGNKLKFYFLNTLWNLVFLVTGGAVLQTVLLEIGFGEEITNHFFAIMQAVQISTIILFSFWSDSVKNIIRVYGLCHASVVPLLTFLLIMCAGRMQYSSTIYILLLGVGIFFNIFYGIYTVISLKVPYLIMDMHDYARVSAVAGLLGGALALGYSSLLSFLQFHVDFFRLMSAVYAITFLLLIGCTTASFMLKKTHHKEPNKSVSSKRIHFLTYKPFTSLIVPNIIRGFSSGILGMAVTIGYYVGKLDSQSASVLVVIGNLVTILGCAVYSLIAGKISERGIILFAAAGVCIFMPMMTAFSSTVTFLLFYGIAFFFRVFVDYGIPVAVTRIVQYETMGQYSAGRMLLNSLGTMLAGFLCVPMFRLFGVNITMVISAAMQLITGISYYTYMKKNNIR